MQWNKIGLKLYDWRGILLTAPTVAIILLAMRWAGWLQPLEWAALDDFFKTRKLEPVDERILIVGVNESDLKKVKQIPVPDGIIAKTLEKIKAQKPKAIGLDLYRDLPVQPGNSELIKVFKSTPNLIGIEKIIEDANSNAIAAPPALKKLDQVGFNDVAVDADGKLRRGLLFSKAPDKRYMSSLGMRLSFIYLQSQGIKPQSDQKGNLKLGKAVFIPFEANDGGYVRADAGGYQILINYRGGARSFRTVSLHDVLENKVPREWIRDRIVLLGPTASSLNDFFYTPFSNQLFKAPERTAGVEIAANITSQIISAAIDGRPLIKTWSDPVETLWIFAWSCVGAILSWNLRLPRYTIMILMAQAVLITSAYITFLQGLWIPVVPPSFALIASAVAITGYIAAIEREDRKTVMNLFGRHVTPQIAEAIWRDRHEILKEGRLMGRKMNATVLFTDLKGFSTIAESIDPELLMSWLNEYMDAMTKIVLERGGVVDKFIGDSIMAIFGVPIPRNTPEAIAQDAQQAISCALEMAAKLKSLNQQWQLEGKPTAAMRVGISTGNVLVGSLGSSQRLDYTTIGDSVNIASRLESYDKSLDGGLCRILISEATYNYIQEQFPTQFIGTVVLKGRQQSEKVYQVILEE